MADIYKKMSAEERLALIQLTDEEKNHAEVMQALQDISHKADENHHSFLLDFAANVAGNSAWDALLWVGSRLLKKI